MIRGSAGCLGIDPTKTLALGQIEFFDEDIDRANRIVLADPVFQAFRKQRGLTAIDPLNEAPHPILPQIARESYRRESRQAMRFYTGWVINGNGALALMSASPSTSDIRLTVRHVSFGPKGDIPQCSTDVHFTPIRATATALLHR